MAWNGTSVFGVWSEEQAGWIDAKGNPQPNISLRFLVPRRSSANARIEQFKDRFPDASVVVIRLELAPVKASAEVRKMLREANEEWDRIKPVVDDAAHYAASKGIPGPVSHPAQQQAASANGPKPAAAQKPAAPKVDSKAA